MKVLVDEKPKTVRDCLFAQEYVFRGRYGISCLLSDGGQEECCLECDEKCPYLSEQVY